MAVLTFFQEGLQVKEKDRSTLYSGNPRATVAGRRSLEGGRNVQNCDCVQEPLGTKPYYLDGDPCAFPVSPTPAVVSK